ncbi:hypothetical protein SEVIR_7G104800v4 [Setaria viridis]|nr:putative UPF0496 protein 2 [Setaria viridis]
MEMNMPAHAQAALLDIEQEYSSMLRTQSNARFLFKKYQSEEEMEALLETQKDLIPPALHNIMVHRRTSSEIERAMADYFDASTEAIEICRQLLRNIKDTQSNYQSMDSFLASITDSTASTSASAPLALKSFPVTSNPFCTTTRSNFRQIHDKYSSILQSIRSSHRKLGRKLKIMKAFKKLSRAFLVMACGGASAAAIGAASHRLFFGVLIGAAAAGLLPIALKRRIAGKARKEKGSSKTCMSLLRLQEQLDTAAKGTYVLGQDLDTVSNLVVRLSDGIERENAMARCCEERSGERSSVLEMVNELRRSCSSSRRLTDELEEHVCLLLATIHKARILVIQEISKKA